MGSLLFEKLREVLLEDEITLFRAIFSRMRIMLGKESLQPNIGVPQGSVTSPALFNIYATSLLNTLENNGWSVDDLLAFADDHLVLSITKSNLRQVIKITKDWCGEANIQLNPDKSGIMEVSPKGVQTTMKVGDKFEGIPVVDEYKYLGLI